ncbi:hypothetical protein D3C84_493030 [compost metagenome]
MDQRSAAVCAVTLASDAVAGHSGGERCVVGGVGAASEVALVGVAVHLADSSCRVGVVGRLAFAVPPGSELGLADVGGSVCRAFRFAATSGFDAAGASLERRPCAGLLVADRGAGAGVALCLAADVRAVQRLALAGLGDSAEPVSGADGRTPRLAMAGIGLRSRISPLRRCAAGTVDARLVLAGERFQ